MAYVVLARKYRPPNFDSLVGQAHVVQALGNALTQQRLHHAYLFTGTRGVGKTTISRILAKSLNCTGADGTGGITAHPCGVCDACRDIDSGRYIDYIELDAASNRGVDEISQLLDQAVYKPVVARFKVYMIDEVHMLSTTAFNAMLKTLEEPPDYLKFVLATTDPQKVPPTVLSRCLQFNLRPMAPQTVREHLATVLAQEGIAAEPAALRLLARAARGSMRDALSLTDQAIAFGAGSLAEAGVRQMLGAVDRSHALALVEALAAGDGAAVVAAVDGLRGLGLSASGTLEEMATLLQQMALLQAVPAAADPDDPDAAGVARVAVLLEADETQLLYSIVLHGRAELGLAPDEYSGLVMVLLRMLAFRPQGASAKRAAPLVAPSVAWSAPVAKPVGTPAVSPVSAPAPRPAVALRAAGPARLAVAREPVPAASDEPPAWLDDVPFEQHLVAELSGSMDALMKAPKNVQKNVQTNVHVDAAPASRVPSPAVVTTATGDRWADIVQKMVADATIGALVRELAMQAECTAIDAEAAPPRWQLRVEREMLRATATCEKLQTALAEALGHDVQLEVSAGVAADSPARRETEARARAQSDAERIIHNDPLVLALMAQYQGARIVPGSVKPH